MTSFLRTLSCVLIFLAAADAWSALPPSAYASDDDYVAAIAQEIRGFAGFYRDGHGNPIVALVGSAGQAAARKRYGAAAQFEPARYEFSQLHRWRKQVTDLLSLPGAVALDLDEVRNRLVVYIDPALRPKNAALYESHIARLGVPRDAVILADAEPIEPAATLRDTIRPAPGGVEIDNGVPTSGICTLGFIAVSEPGYGILTASHCTEVQGGVEGTSWLQGTSGLAYEYLDPDFFTGGACPSGRRCRRSDSAWGLIYTAGTGELTKIAKPQTQMTTCDPGTLTIDANQPRFTIRSRLSGSPTVNETLSKVGRTTGWTSGSVTSTCVDLNYPNTDITILCLDRVAARVGGGDSGSPVFAFNGGDDATAYGIIAARSGSCAFYFSNLNRIEYELGPLLIH